LPIPEYLITFLKKFRLIDKLNIEISIGNKIVVINRTNFNTLQFDRETQAHIDELLRRDFGFGRLDLAPLQSEIAYQALTHEEIIKTLKQFLSEPDLGALACAAAIVRMEDEKKDAARVLTVRLAQAYGSRGKKIYNMLRSRIFEGTNIFQSIVCPFLDLVKKTYPDDPWKVRGIFGGFFEDILKYYPHGVWIAPKMDYKKVLLAVMGRVKDAKVPVSIYARGSKDIETAKQICAEILKERSDLEVIKEDYTLGMDIACMMTIVKRKRKQEELGQTFS